MSRMLERMCMRIGIDALIVTDATDVQDDTMK